MQLYLFCLFYSILVICLVSLVVDGLRKKRRTR